MNKRLTIVAFITGLMCVLSIYMSSPSIIYAHANHLKSEPVPNSELEESPNTVTIWFTETIEPLFSNISVLDQNGLVVDRQDSLVDPNNSTIMSVSLPSLPDGTYTVVWKNISTVDGHILRGAFIFSVGEPISDDALSSNELGSWKVSPPEPILRWAILVGALIVLGGLFFDTWIAIPILSKLKVNRDNRQILEKQPFYRFNILMLGALVFIGASIGQLILQTVAVYETSLGDVIGRPLIVFLLGTQWGILWVLRICLMAMVVFLLLAGRQDIYRKYTWLEKINRVVLLAMASGSLLTLSLTSHGAATAGVLVSAVATDYIHLLAASVWLGGLFYLTIFVVCIIRLESVVEKRLLLKQLLPRFSVTAGVSVIILIITGLFSSWIQITVLSGLATPYGFVLITKVLLFIGLLCIGAFNVFWIRRKLNEQNRISNILRNVLVAELSIAGLLIVTVALLTSLEPGRQAASRLYLDVKNRPVLEDVIDRTRITLHVSPGSTGINDFNITAKDVSGDPINSKSTVELSVIYAEMDLGSTTSVAVLADPGEYLVKGKMLSLSGAWQANIVIRQPNEFDTRTAFRFDVRSEDLGNSTWIIPDSQITNIFWGIEIGLIGFLFIVVSLLFGGWWNRGGRWAMSCGFVLFCVGMIVSLSSGMTVEDKDTVLINPVLPTTDSVSIGNTLYVNNCLSCHGDDGRGGGYISSQLTVAPADLTEHVPLHSDSELYKFIYDGIEDTPMYGFSDTLEPTEIWNIINYIKILEVDN